MVIPTKKRNNFAAKVNSENQEKLLICVKRMRVHPLGKASYRLCRWIKAGSRQQLLAGIRVPALQGGCNAARKFPVNGIANAQPQRAAPTGAITES